MLKLLIVDATDVLANKLAVNLRQDFQIKICRDGNAALRDLHSFQPDALILDFFLPYKDGLTVLEECEWKPKVIIGLTPYLNDYTVRRAAALNVQYIIRIPCTVQVIQNRLMDILNTTVPADRDLQVSTLLHLLNFHTHLDGYRQLCLGIPLFLETPGMLMMKELYPAISRRLEGSDPRAVEHSIRKSIADAWLRRDPAVWNKYFPPKTTPPTNKEFISSLAEHLKQISASP